MSNSMSYGIKVKNADMSRAVWISPRGTTGLKIHASGWDTKAEADRAADQLRDLNEGITFTVARLLS